MKRARARRLAASVVVAVAFFGGCALLVVNRARGVGLDGAGVGAIVCAIVLVFALVKLREANRRR